MAEIAPLQTLRYDTGVAGPLQALVSPPYDVIDAAMREQLAAGSPYNVVGVDLPEGGDDRYDNAARLIARWREDGALTIEDEPAIWVLRQEYIGPDGGERVRHGIFCRVRVQEYGPGKIRPHERTHPGPKQDRLNLMHATRVNLSPIFSLFSDEQGEFTALVNAATGAEPFDRCTDLDGSRNTLWRVGDSATIAALTDVLANRELLIADGHHRYETARTYAAEIGGEGAHNYVLMFLCSLQDPGMTVFPTHRLIAGSSPERRAAVAETIESLFDATEIPAESLAPEDNEDTSVCELGYLDSFQKRAYRLKLKDQAAADAALAGRSLPYRRLDTAILEALFLKGALGMTDDDISHLNGLWYSSELAEARELVESGKFEIGFFLRATPISQIQDVAAAGETMPPKSTYFYPKIPTGLVFNPLF